MKRLKKFNDLKKEKVDNTEIESILINENKNLKDMEMGLDLTKIYSKEWVLQKAVEYLKENKHM